MAHIAVHGSRKMGGVDDDSNNMVLAVKEIWEKMHPNGNNEVERDDIAMGFEEAVKHKLSAEELDELMSEVDADGGGSIDFDEFAAWMMSSSKLAEELRHKVDTKFGNLDNFVDDYKVKQQERANSSQFIWMSEDGGMAHTIFVLLEEPGSSTLAVVIGSYIQIMIFIGSIIFIAESLESIKVDKDWLHAFHVIEWFCVANFTVEYVGRVALCWTREGKTQSVLAYMFETMNLIDLAAILPSYVEAIFFNEGGGGLEILRVLRMARILRMVKLGSFELYLGLVVESLGRSKVGLSLFLYLVILFTVIMATFMYMIEGNPHFINAQPHKFLSIPTTSWCIFVTMSSVGYGDMFPISDEGRILGSVVMVSGILTLAVPITLVGNRFNDVWVEHKKRERRAEMENKIRTGVTHTAGDDSETKDAKKPEKENETAQLEPAVNAELQSKSAKLMARGILEHCFKLTKDECFKNALELVWTQQDQQELENEKKAERDAIESFSVPNTPKSDTGAADEFSNPLANGETGGGAESGEKAELGEKTESAG